MAARALLMLPRRRGRCTFPQPGVRIRRATLSLAFAAPGAMAAAQLAAARLAAPLAWCVFAVAGLALGLHLVAIDALVCHWMLTLFPPQAWPRPHHHLGDGHR